MAVSTTTREPVLALAACVSLFAACGPKTTEVRPVAKPRPAAAPARTRIAVLPVESDAYPKLARALNTAFDGTSFESKKIELLRPKASLEVIQLSIECVEATTACWSAVGKSLGAEQVVLSQLFGSGKRRDKQVRIALTVFDARHATPIDVAEQTFTDEGAAERGLSALVARAADATRRAAESEGQSPGGAP